MAVRFTMLLSGPKTDDEGRSLVLRHWPAGIPRSFPPETLILDPHGEVLERLRGNFSAEDVILTLRTVLERRPDLAPIPEPRSEEPDADGMMGRLAFAALKERFLKANERGGWVRHFEGWLSDYDSVCPEEAVEARLLRGVAFYHAGDFARADAAWAEMTTLYPEHPLRHRAAFLRRESWIENGPGHPLLTGAPMPGIEHRPPVVPDPVRRASQLADVQRNPLYQPGPLGLPMVWIAAGTFLMGGSPALFEREFPVREVTIRRPFLISAWPVTRRIWRSFQPSRWPGDESEGLAGDLPAIGISFREAEQLCAFLSAQDGRPWRLPTEAEWEYAARGGLEATQYPWGDEPIGPERCNAALPRPVPVACYPPNAYGLFDMVGNVGEWTVDLFHEHAYSSTPRVCADPIGSTSSDLPLRVVRGGFCGAPVCALMCRNSWRLGVLEQHRGTIGLRLVCDGLAPMR